MNGRMAFKAGKEDTARSALGISLRIAELLLATSTCEVDMCIICNCGDDGDNFLWEYQLSRDAMNKAKEAMLKCMSAARQKNPKSRKYDATHKAMVRLIREWNRLEETRELT